MTGHIVRMGAGPAVMERRSEWPHADVPELPGNDEPAVLFGPTRSAP